MRIKIKLTVKSSSRRRKNKRGEETEETTE